LNFDDMVENLVAHFSKVLSPHKVEYVPKNVNEKLPKFYSDVQSSSRSRCRVDDDQDSTWDDR
ncbi:hypothetical protein BAE44_0022098, partial [Dichanthelium oligosanthes]